MRTVLMADGVRHWAHRRPRHPAVNAGPRTLTYGELHDRLERVAGGAAALGLRAGDRAAFLAPNCLEYVEVSFGFPTAGVIVCALSPSATPADIAAICADAEPRVMIVHPSLEETVRAADTGVERTLVLGPEYDAWLEASPAERPAVTAEETEVCWLHYTSGTTGRPKGVAVSHHAKAAHYLSSGLEYGFSHEDHHLVVGALAHGVASGKAFTHIFLGATVTLAPIFHPERIVRTLETKRITTTMMVPSHLKAILELGEDTLGRYDISSLRTLVVGGAPCAQATKEAAIAWLGDGVLFEDYGSTELGLISMLHPPDHVRKVQSVGQPAFGVEIKLLDEDGHPVPTGEIGEMHVASTSIFCGYWNRPEETASAMRGEYYRTGDLARLDEESFIYLLDRMNDKIISGGFNVYAREIEEVLVRHPAVADAVAFGVPDEQLGEAVRAAVVLAPGVEVGESELDAFCAQELAHYKRPKWIDVHTELPRTATGKVQRRTLREPYWAGMERRIS